MEREPEILIVNMPPCRMATSGVINDEPTFHRFERMWSNIGRRIGDKVNARDFMHDDPESGHPIWLFLLDDSMTEAETDGFEIVNFPGGLFAVVHADNWEKDERARVCDSAKAWVNRQEHLELDETPVRHIMFHFAGPHSAQMKEWGYAKVRYFIPIKVKQ